MINKDISRRKFLQISALAAGATMLPMPVRWLGSSSAQAFAQSPPLLKKDAYKLRGLALPTKVLGVIPAAAFYAYDPAGIPVLDGTPDAGFANTLMYDVTAGEYTDTLHPLLGPTKLWGYYDTTAQVKRHLGGLIIASRGTATRLRMTNTLPSVPLIPNDSSLLVTSDGAAQNRIAIHLHGGYVPWISDGGPFDWWSPANSGGGTGQSYMNGPGSVLDNITGKPIVAGQGDLFYPNDQSSRLMWYHDHAHGITRTNAYAGLATGYLCLDLAQEAQYMSAGVASIVGLPAGQYAGQMPQLTELIPLVFQDKVFVNATPVTGTLATDPTWATVSPKGQTEGSLWYAHIYDPKLYRQKKGRGILPPPNPSCVPEFFGDTMLCNGTIAPVVEVEARRFRFMLLNACNARFFNINMLEVQPNCEVTTGNLGPVMGVPIGQYNYVTKTPVAALPKVGPKIIQIGTEGGYLQQPAVFPATTPLATNGNIIPFNPATFSGNLIVGNAERVDCIIDFSGYPVGSEFVFYSDSPGPFPGGAPTNDYYAGNINTPSAIAGSTVDTRNILRFRIKALGPIDSQTVLPTLPAMDPPSLATAPVITAGVVAPLAPLIAPQFVRDLTLNEDFDAYGRLRQLLGTTKPALVGKGFGLEYMAPATEIIAAGTTEVWRFYNLTADTHPMHFHLQDCQILSRQPFKLVNGIFTPTGALRGPELNELGWKETVKLHPGEVTSVIFKWDMVPVPFDVPYSTRTMGAAGASIAQANEFVWHCHILEHEEHDMMRPLVITGKNPQKPNITPTAATVTATGAALPQTVPFSVTTVNGIKKVDSNNINYSATLTATGFSVTVNPLLATVPPTPATLVTFTVTDNTLPTGYTASVLLTIN